MPTFHLLIKGKVQGVFYRATAKEIADELGITGWVKNTPEGNVESVVCGADSKLQQFVAWCKKGPSRAKVTDVIITGMEDTAFESFTVIR